MKKIVISLLILTLISHLSYFNVAAGLGTSDWGVKIELSENIVENSIITTSSALEVTEDISKTIMEYFPDDNFAMAIADVLGMTITEDFTDSNGIILENIQTKINGISYLNLNNKNIYDITGIENFSNISKLELNSNALLSLPSSFNGDNFKKLSYVSLNNNDGLQLPDTFIKFPELSTLNLNECNMVSLPDIFNNTNMPNLNTLSITGNKNLKELPENFNTLSKLSTLDLQNNGLEALPEGFGNFSSLTSLYLNDNKLTSIPNGFVDSLEIHSLFRIYLNNNNLVTLPDGFANSKKFPGLLFIHLDNNKLTALPDSFCQGYNFLYQIFLNNNRLIDVNEEQYKNIKFSQEYTFDNQRYFKDMGVVCKIGEAAVFEGFPIYEQLMNYGSDSMFTLKYPDNTEKLIFPTIIDGNISIDSSLISQAGTYTLLCSVESGDFIVSKYEQTFFVKGIDISIVLPPIPERSFEPNESEIPDTTYTPDPLESDEPTPSNSDEPTPSVSDEPIHSAIVIPTESIFPTMPIITYPKADVTDKVDVTYSPTSSDDVQVKIEVGSTDELDISNNLDIIEIPEFDLPFGYTVVLSDYSEDIFIILDSEGIPKGYVEKDINGIITLDNIIPFGNPKTGDQTIIKGLLLLMLIIATYFLSNKKNIRKIK